MKFNEFLKRARENASLTQETASSAIGVGISTIQNWERGSNKPEITILPEISKAYKVPTKTLLEILAEDLDIIDEEAEPQNLKKYQSLLPDGLDYSILNELSFNEIEQEAFLTFAMNVNFSGNPIPEMSKFFIDAKHLAAFISKLKSLNLFETLTSYVSYLDGGYARIKGNFDTSHTQLTKLGAFLYQCMIHSNKSAFSTYDLNFKDFVHLLGILNIIEDVPNFIETLETLTSNEFGVKLEEFRYYYNSRRKYDLPLKTHLHAIDNCYYQTEEEENTDDDYAEKKCKYLSELHFYQNTPGFEDKLKNLKHLNDEIVSIAYPTKKALDFMNEYNVFSSE